MSGTDAAAAARQQPPLYVLAYGDSLTAGYHSNGAAFAPYAHALAAELLAQQQQQQQQQQPAAATIDVRVDVSGASGLRVSQLASELYRKSGYDVADREYVGLGCQLRGRRAGPSGAGAQYAAALIMGGTNDLVSQNVYLLSRRGPVYRRMPAVLTPTATR
jgi:hypothetical protein